MKKTASGYRLIFGYLGLFIIFVGLATFLPLFALFEYAEEAKYWYCFAIPGGCAIAIGCGLFSLIVNRTKAQLGKHQDSILLVLVWLCAILISSVPFLIQGNFSFTDAIFETTSAYATVGLSIFKAGDYNLHLFVLYRSLLCFVGGIGLVLIITSAISDRYGLKLYLAEGHNDKLMPNLARSARLMLSIYTGITIVGALLFMAAGMPAFDAIVHSISAVATGGFSSKPDGLMAFSSYGSFWAIQLIAIILMLMGATNFLLHVFLLTGKFKKVLKDCEVRLVGALTCVFIPLFVIAILARKTNADTFGEALSHGSFTFISALTTTGFTNVAGGVTILGEGILFLIVIVNVIGGGMGSTAGGVKQYRFAIAIKSFYWSTKEHTSSSNIIYPHYVYRFGEEKEIESNDIAYAFGYIMLYVIIMFIGGLLVTIFSNGSFTYGESLFEFSNALSSTGMSNGICSTGNDGVKWVLTLGMFAGRLEILVIYFALFRVIRDIFGKETI